MSLKRFRTYAKNTLLIALSMIVMAGATGLSYKAHYCHGNLSGVAFYTELGIQKPASCGCKEDITNKNPLVGVLIPDTLKKNTCCSNISFFSKLNIVKTANDYSHISLMQPDLSVAFITISEPLVFGDDDFSIANYEYPPPLHVGRDLVLFLSQQRIPLIFYNN